MIGRVLYAEDDENDAYFMRRAFAKAGLPHELHLVADGRAAIDYLTEAGALADPAARASPTLILLDVKMPGVTGLGVLHWIRQHPEFDPVPVVMLTSSNQERDLREAFVNGANGYLLKPSNADELTTLLRAVLTSAHAVSGSFRERWLDFAGNHPPPRTGFTR